MKTYHLKDLLKKDVLIIEWQDDYEIVGRIIFGKSNQKGVLENIFNLDGYTLLGKPDEIKEEDAQEVVHKAFDFYRNYLESEPVGNYQRLVKKTAIESLFSLLESEIYWENPWGVNGAHLDSYKDLWHKAEQKTFDKNRSLIFVKN